MPGGTPYDGLYGEAPPKIKGVPFSMLLDVVACCCPKFETGQTFQPTTPNISFVPWSPKRLHSSSNIVGATHVDYAWVTKIYWLYPSHDALQVSTLMGPACATLMGPTLMGPVLHPIVHHCQHAHNNSQHCWRNNVGSCCVRLHAA